MLFGPGEYVDMVKAGIIDPLKVIRTALVDAARYVDEILISVSLLHLSFIFEDKESASSFL